MSETPNKPQQPEGAAKLVDQSKVKQVLPPVEVDDKLKQRGAPGQGSGDADADKAEKKEPPPPDRTKLPKDENGEPRNLTLDEARTVKQGVIEKLKTVFDPEIPVNIYDLGMIYNVSVGLTGEVHVKMTLTSPACPVAGTLPGEVEENIRSVEHVTAAKVELVWEPAWNKSMMTEAAKLELNVM
jgi:FeS assembly SUF system protein